MDDEPKQVSAFARILEQEGYEVVIAKDDLAALYLLDEFRPDLIILDIGFGSDERKGFDILKAILAKDNTIPIFILTGHDDDELEWLCLELKAVDFVSKSKPLKVLLARIKARLPRALREPISIDDCIKIDLGNYLVKVKRTGEWHEAHLEPLEFEVLKKLVSNPGWVIPREILESYFPEAKDPAATLNRYISELRKRLEPDPGNPEYVLTKPGVGYWFKEYR
ncbi:MAG: response regulator transcription factor [Phycisphaerales bacterium]|nr:MAG: response regulator transcription factor [Phycisphaerales bacterium]